MNWTSITILAAALAGASPLAAQKADPFSGELKQLYDHIKNDLTRMADKMAEADYSFKPAPETRTFSQIIAHLADTQLRTCSALNGAPKSPNAASKTAKGELVAALKESFSICDQAFDSLTDATALETFMLPQGQHHSKAALLIATISHANEEYGYMAVYLRLKGIVPPSSERPESARH
jgi:hypothetical protein